MSSQPLLFKPELPVIYCQYLGGACRREGHRQAVGLGSEIKHLNSSSHSELLSQMQRRKIADKLNVGWKHPWATQLLDCVTHWIDTKQRRPWARWAWHCCVPATQKAEQLNRDKILSFKWKTFSRHNFFMNCLCTTQCRGYGGLLIPYVSHTSTLKPPLSSLTQLTKISTRSPQ